MLVMSSVPIFSAIISWLALHEGLGIWEFIGMALTLAGIALVILRRSREEDTHRVTFRGVLYGFFGALGQAGGLILAKQAFLIAPVNSFVATLIRICASLIILVPLAIATGRIARPVQAFRKDRKALVFMLLGSFVGPYLGITFSLIAISHTNVGVASTIMSTVPIIMLPMVHFFYHEKLNWRAYTGAVLAVAGTAVLFLV
jgi:drug/metabolite transporter (DMT)-like permease